MMVPSPLGSPASSIPAPSRATDGLPTLRLLGGAIIVGADGKPLGGPAAHRHRIALLALLAVSGLMSRDKLVAYLWPERDSAGARNLLKTAVHGLRKVLGDDAIESIGDQLQLNTARLRCDVTDFEAAVTAADWSLADSLYTGPFLDGFFVKGASDFEDWTSARRMRLDEAYARVVRELRARETTDPGSPATAEPLLDASGPLAADAVPAETAPPTTPPRQTRRGLAAWFGIGVIAAALIFVAQRQGFGVGQPAKPTAVILPDDDPGTALEFNGVDTDVSTVDGSVITPQTDDIAWDMLVRFDGTAGALSRSIRSRRSSTHRRGTWRGRDGWSSTLRVCWHRRRPRGAISKL